MILQLGFSVQFHVDKSSLQVSSHLMACIKLVPLTRFKKSYHLSELSRRSVKAIVLLFEKKRLCWTQRTSCCHRIKQAFFCGMNDCTCSTFTTLLHLYDPTQNLLPQCHSPLGIAIFTVAIFCTISYYFFHNQLLPRHIEKSIATSRQHILMVERILFIRLARPCLLSGNNHNIRKYVYSIIITECYLKHLNSFICSDLYI